jgi:hypothetical protein
VISQARAALVDLLDNAGFRTFDYVPPNITPPCAVVFPSTEFVTTGETFGEYIVSFDVRIFAQALTNNHVTVVMDGYIEDALDGINGTAGFYLETVNAPEMYTENNSTFLGVELTVKQLTRP